MARGFVTLAAVVDWFSRLFLSHRISIGMEAEFCIEFTGVLKKSGIAISHRIAGRDPFGSLWTAKVPILDQTWRGNFFVERLWRSVQYEEVYLRAYDTLSEARTSIGKYLEFYHSGRPHSSLDRQTPDQAYFSAKAVDMTLCLPQSLANADALPTFPQQEQKTQPRAA